MPLSLRRWSATHLLAAWVAYWVVLALVALGRPLLLIWEISKPPSGRANASLGFGDGGFNGQVVVDGVTRWQAHTSFVAAALWIVIPPLLIWLAWLAVRPRPEEIPPPPPRELGAGPLPDATARQRDRARHEP